MQLRIRQITYLALDINGYELVDPRGRDLPRFTAGAHIGVQRGGRAPRDYSLWNDPAERRRYCIAVQREPAGAASRDLHDRLRVGDLLEVRAPRNHFPLAEDALDHLLIAGGIGITPILAMVAELKRRKAPFMLHYCARSPERTAFRDDLALLAAQGRVRFHYDDDAGRPSLDLAALLRDRRPGTHFYYCGPPSLMAAAAEAARHWERASVHCEDFAAPALVTEADRPFRVRLASTGDEYEVPVGETIVRVLRRHGHAVTTSCELGYCGACLTRYLAGEPDHRDQIGDAASRRSHVLICCARAKTPVLEIDR